MTPLIIRQTKEQALLKRTYEIEINQKSYFFETHALDGAITYIDLIDPDGNRIHDNIFKHEVLNCTKMYHEQVFNK
jgi:hypothetical protein